MLFFTVFSPSSRGKPLLPTRNSLLRGGPRFVQKVFRHLVLSLYCRQAPLLCNVVPLPCLFVRCAFCGLSLVFQVFVLRTYCRQKPPFFLKFSICPVQFFNDSSVFVLFHTFFQVSELNQLFFIFTKFFDFPRNKFDFPRNPGLISRSTFTPKNQKI